MIITQNRKWLEAIGETLPQPVYLREKRVFEYTEISVEIVAYLKAVRAVQSLTSLPILCNQGLITDYYTVIRCILECVDHIYFLLEKYPAQSNEVSQYIEHFKSTTIENAKTQSSHRIRQDKIHTAVTRARNSPRDREDFDENDKVMKKLVEGIWRATCNAVHTNYSEVMQSYGGPAGNRKFQLAGIPSDIVIRRNSEWIVQINILVGNVLGYIASKFGMEALTIEIRQQFLASFERGHFEE